MKPLSSNILKKFKVMSYNIWFEQNNRLERLESLFATIIQSNPDVICLQEVLPDIYTILKSKLKEYPYHFPESINNRYGSVIMSKYNMTNCIDKKFVGSRMGRSLLISSIQFPVSSCTTVPIVIGNTHFESEFQKKEANIEKLNQYNYSKQFLDSVHNDNSKIIFCSDTNLLAHEEDLFFADFKWKDSWKEKGCVSKQFTYDYFTNNNLREKNVGKFRSRLDRILYRNENLNVMNFSIIEGIDGMIPPSDHHGVEATFCVLG